MDNLPVSDSRTDIVSSNDKSLTDDASIMSADKEHASDAILSADSIHTIDNKTSTAAFRGSGTLLAEKGQFADNGTLKGDKILVRHSASFSAGKDLVEDKNNLSAVLHDLSMILAFYQVKYTSWKMCHVPFYRHLTS